MKLNGIEIRISLYTAEALNDEMVLYNEESKKIIVLNQTAMLVWKEIRNSYLNGTDICTSNITNVILDVYSLPKSDFETVNNDVNETIELLFQSNLLSK